VITKLLRYFETFFIFSRTFIGVNYHVGISQAHESPLNANSDKIFLFKLKTQQAWNKTVQM